jgi:hypothetical protein
MADAYRIAVRVPWDADWGPDWGPRWPHIDQAMAALRQRVDRRKHRGKGFRQRGRDEAFGPIREMAEALEIFGEVMTRSDPGDIRFLMAVKDHVIWMMRHVEVPDPVIDRPEANQHVDWIYTHVFRELRSQFPDAENWGTCNRRFIAGTTIWSEHCPWPAALPQGEGANAIDIHDSATAMHALAYDHLAGQAHVAKILYADHEWLPSGGWRPVPGIGHYDHIHVEGPREHGPSPLASCSF